MLLALKYFMCEVNFAIPSPNQAAPGTSEGSGEAGNVAYPSAFRLRLSATNLVVIVFEYRTAASLAGRARRVRENDGGTSEAGELL